MGHKIYLVLCTCCAPGYLMTLSNNAVCSFREQDCCFHSSCWIIEQSYHYTSRPSIYSTIRIVVLLMDPSISLCEGQPNTCINRKKSHMYTHIRRLQCCHTVVVVEPSWEQVVFQQWSEYVRKCAYTMATCAGSTVLQEHGCPSTSQETSD